jgi:outer membrane receptor for ferrienterochelin and colicins
MHHIGKLVLAGLVAAGWFTGAAAQGTADIKAETEMEKTVVTATRTRVSLRDAPGAITIISAEDIKDMTANDIMDIVRETAGVSLVGRGAGGRTVVSVRGLENRQTLILIDGKRVAASDPIFGHSDFEQNWLPLESIERIEVVRGPLSALYGSEAMGGVINIITQKSTGRWHGSVKAGGGVRADNNGGENQSCGAHLAGPIVKDKLGISISAEHIRDENTPDPDDSRYTEIEEKEVSSADARLTFTPTENHTLEADLTIVSDDRHQDSVSKGVNYEDIYRLDKVITSLSWKGTIGPTRSTVTAYRSDIDKDSRKAYENGKVTEYPERLINDVLDAQTSFSIGSNLLTLGAEFRKEELESTTLLEGRDDVDHQAFFFQDELSLFGDRLLLTPGVRWDDHETFGSETSPRLYALYKITDHINLKAGYGHAFRAPTVKQVSEGYYSANSRHIFVGNPDVEPEKSDAYEAGVEYFGEKFFGRAIFFYNAIDDLIAYDRIGASGSTSIYAAANVDKAETRGIETEIGVTLPHGFKFMAAYTYLEAEDTENNVRLSGKPRNSISARLKHAWDAWGLFSSLRVQYIGDQVFENDDDDLEEVPDYALWHFSVRKRIPLNFEIQLGVDNITDVRLADETDLFSYEERGRFYYANLRYSF